MNPIFGAIIINALHYAISFWLRRSRPLGESLAGTSCADAERCGADAYPVRQDLSEYVLHLPR
jgi:hypothetical protein